MSIKDRILAFERGQPIQEAPIAPTLSVSSSPPSSRSDDIMTPQEAARSSLAAARARAASSAPSSGVVSSSVGGLAGGVGASPTGSSALSTRQAISRSLSAGNFAEDTSSQNLSELAGGSNGTRPIPPSPRRPKAEIMSLYKDGASSTSSRPESPSAHLSASNGLSGLSTVASHLQPSAASSSSATPPSLPQRKPTLPTSPHPASSASPAVRAPPSIASKPAHLAKQSTETLDLHSLMAASPATTREGTDMISFSPVEPGPRRTTAVPRTPTTGHGSTPAASAEDLSAALHESVTAPLARPAPPKLPSRQSTTSSTASIPPPLPARKPTLTSSPANRSSAPSLRRQPPPPPRQRDPFSPSLITRADPAAVNPVRSQEPAAAAAAAARYDALFTQLLALRQVAKTKRVMTGAAAWEVETREGWLDGVVVKGVWERSRLPSAVLRDVWSKVDPDGSGSLDRDAFVKGMGLVDAQLASRRGGRR